MKAPAYLSSSVAALPALRIGDLAELAKARLTSLVLVTTFVGFYVGSAGNIDWALLLHTLVGTGLVVGGAGALNQVWEHDADALMARTCDRPIPAGRMSLPAAMGLGLLSSVVGMIHLAVAVHPRTALLGALAWVIYLLVYTPLKRVSVLNTWAGAIAGALPPFMGWSATDAALDGWGWILFGILFFWQLPHFLAIGWLHRDEYRRAGFRILPVVDATGQRTAGQVLLHTAGLVAVSVLPFLTGHSGILYLSGALVLGALFMAQAIRFARALNPAQAQRLFFFTLAYLPLLMLLLVINQR